MFEYYDKDKMLVPIKIWTESIDDIEESCLEQAAITGISKNKVGINPIILNFISFCPP